MSSTEFRLVYSKLRYPVEVQVHGHVIGTWYPAGQRPQIEEPTEGDRKVAMIVDTLEAGFGTARPAPKPTKRKRA